jgi:hypothetical protein
VRPSLALILGTAAGLLLAEGGLRVALGYHGITPTRDIQYDRELGWTLIPGVHAWQSAIDYGVWVTTDADGLRVDERAQAAASPDPTLLILGDSFAFGYGVAASDMLATALERELSRTATPYRVRTAGVPGYATDQELLRFRRLAPIVRPRRVLLLFHDSDFVDNTRTSVVIGPERYFKPRFELRGGRLDLAGVPVPPKERVSPETMFEPVKSWMRPLASYALVQMVSRRAAAAARSDVGPAPAVTTDADAITEALVSALDREVRAAGADLMIAVASSDPHGARRVGRICRAQNLPLVDLSSAVAGRDVRLPYDGHWNARGHALAARAIAAAVR